MNKLKVLIADDTALYRRILTDAVKNTGHATVEYAVSNGAIVIERLRQHDDIDVVLLDVFMPELDGIDTLRIIKKEFPDVEVIMISGEASSSAENTVEALKLGAVDFIMKPKGEDASENIDKITNSLRGLFALINVKKCSKSIEQITGRRVKIVPKQTEDEDVEKSRTKEKAADKSKPLTKVDLILIASSTGGPSALEKVLTCIPHDIKKPILIVQHMPPDFTKALSKSLDRKCSINVKEGEDGEIIKDGGAIIAPGGFHMIVESADGRKKIRLIDTPHVNGVKPAADVLFESVSREYSGKNVLVAVLTGMGSDGMRGVEKLKNRCNCYCITQSERTCVVYGMPRSVYEKGLSDESLDIEDIGVRIVQLVSGMSGM